MTLRPLSRQITISTLASCLVLAACGGGDGASSGAVSATASGKAFAQAAKSDGTTAAPALTSSTIVVTAAATSAGGRGAIMELWTNGVLAGTAEVTEGQYREFTFTIAPVTPGETIDVVYTNDGSANGTDRNFFVRDITVDGVVHAPSEASYDLGFGAAAFDGQDVIPGTSGMFWAGALRYRLAGNPNATPAPKGFYVDATNGNDGNLGTYDHPFKTLKRLTDVRLATGDGIYLKCGQIWRESLSLHWLQLVSGSIVAGYGDCSNSKAVLSGADDFSGGWVKTGNAWMRAVPASTPQITRLFVNGAPARVAQWPNQTTTSQGYALAAAGSSSSTTQLKVGGADLAALSGQDIRGATVHMRSLPWVIETRTVDSFNTTDGSLRWATPTDYSVEGREGFILQNKLWMLDAPGEFFHDKTTNVLYVYPADAASQANMNSASVEGSVRDTVLSLSNRPYMTLKNLSLQKGRVNGLQMTDTEQASIDAIEASNNGNAGVALYQWTPVTAGLTGISLTNSTVAGNSVYGVDARFVAGAQISGNRVLETGTLASAAWSGAAIQTGPGANVDRNVIDGSAYHGIHYSGADFAKVTRNSVSNYCKRLSDCGGIYTWNGPKGSARIAGQISRVEGNLLNAASSNVEGVNGGNEDVVAGIYLDDFSRAVHVKGNTVQGTPVGIFVHNGSDISVEANKVWLTTDAALVASMDQTDQDYMQRNVFVDNQLVPFTVGSGALPATPTFKSSLAVRFVHYLNGASSIATGANTFLRNQVVQLNGSAVQAFAHVSSNSTHTPMNAAQWAALNRNDAAPISPLTFAVYDAALGAELVPPGGLNAPNGWGMWFANGNYSNLPREGSNLTGCTGVCITLSANSMDDLLYSSKFWLNLNTTYVYSYNAAATSPVTVRAPYISRFVTPWDSMAAGGYITLGGRSGETVRYEGFFTAKASDHSRVNLQLETLSVPVTFSGMSVRPVTSISYSKLSDWAAVAGGTALDARTVDCADLGWPAGCRVASADGTALSLPFNVPAGSQQLFLRTDSTWRR